MTTAVSFPVYQRTESPLYSMNVKNRDFGKEDPQNLHSERGTIAERQGPSENANYEVNPTQPGVPEDRFDLWGRAQPKTDSSCSLGINAIDNRDAAFLNSLDADELKDFLDEIVLDLSPNQMNLLADLLSLESLEAAVRKKYPDHVSALETALAMLEEAKYYLKTTECKTSPSLKACLGSIIDLLFSVLESFIRAFGIADFFKPPDNAFEGEFKSQKIMMLLSLFTMMSGILIPLLGAELAALIIGGSLLGIAALSLIYPLIKPQASLLPRGENWTAALKQGNLFVADGRQESLDQMARTLIEGSHVMLLGKTGVGKTAVAKAFAQAVERGDYPELQGKQIFYFNTADLLSGTEAFSSANKIFSQISEAMGHHRDNFILIFDEIHMACKEQDQGTLSEQLKTYLDDNANNFPYVIGITTEEEFYREIYQRNSAFARRFQQVVIDNTEDSETVKILQNALLKQAPELLLDDDDVLKTLLDKTKVAFKEAAQPGTSLKILSQCINKTAASQRSPKEVAVDKKRANLQALYAQGAGTLPYRENGAKALEAQLRDLEAELKTVKEQIDALFNDRDALLELKKSTLRKITQGLNDKRELNLLSLELHFEARLRADKIRADAGELDIKTVIDAELIDEVIAEEEENNQRVLDAIQQGAEQINEREF